MSDMWDLGVCRPSGLSLFFLNVPFSVSQSKSGFPLGVSGICLLYASSNLRRHT